MSEAAKAALVERLQAGREKARRILERDNIAHVSAWYEEQRSMAQHHADTGSWGTQYIDNPSDSAFEDYRAAGLS